MQLRTHLQEFDRTGYAYQAARLEPRAQDHEIKAGSVHYAGRVRTHLQAFTRRQGMASTAQELAGTLNGIAVACQARPVAPDVSLAGRIARMVEPQWWVKNLRRSLLREAETIEHAAGNIRRKKDCYVSSHAVLRVLARDKANREILDGLEVVNELGQACNLLEVSDASVSNPALRRAELMTRCRGFEETAAYMGHLAVFLTITAPSRFHRFAADGRDNPAWRGATPRDAQAYLCKVWQRIRAELGRQGIYPYGFRIAEPHHDACPHWHLLLFVPPHQAGWFKPEQYLKAIANKKARESAYSCAVRYEAAAGLVGIVGAYALQDTPGERGAVKHRFTCERIDTSKGSATGYIAKYICKNVDGITEAGDSMGLDFASGKPAHEGARRVRTWASVWGIRQFQQIGGPSVTVWRELRRLGKDLENPLQLECFEGPRAAADRALWSLFWVLQGGPDVKRSELTLRPFYVDGQAGRYGDEVIRTKGVAGRDDDGAEHVQVTRPHEWTVQRAGQAQADAVQALVNAEHEAQRRASELVRSWGFESLEAWEDFQRQREARAPWTGVNNCTPEPHDDDAAALEADRLRGKGGEPMKEEHHERPYRTPIRHRGPDQGPGEHPATGGRSHSIH